MSDVFQPEDRRRGRIDPKLLELLVCPLTKGRLEYDEAAQELIQPLQLRRRCIAVDKIADAEDRIRLLLRHAREQRRGINPV